MKTIFVYSAKGGVGKSTLACNLAYTLQSTGKKVGLFDADFKTPSIAKLIQGIELERQPIIKSMRIAPARTVDGLLIQSTAYFNQNELVFWTDDYIEGALWQLFNPEDWAALNYLIVDLPPAIEPIHAQLCALFPDAKVILASTYSPLSIEDCTKGISFLHELEMDIMGVVMNMVYIDCEHCHQPMRIFNSQRDSLPLPVLAELPLSATIVDSAERGLPLAFSAPKTQELEIFRELAASIEKKL